MDYKSVVYNAARDGNLNRLKIYLHGNKGKEEVAMLVTAKTGGATPLVIACRNGHYDVAEYLIEKCNADIEQPGSVIFDGETIEGAPPLWCAAAAGHMSVVQLLVSRGARVNSTTRTNSTPLRAACFDGHYEIVRYLVQHGADIEVANRHGHTCLMIACYKGHYKIARYLLCLRAAVNRKSVKGNTALHDCAESGSLDILKLLLEHGAAIDVDSYGMTPLLAAAVTGHSHIVEHLVRLPRLVSRAERVDALELLGATYVDKRRDMVGALALWKRAMDERFRPGALPLPKPSPAPPVTAYEHAREARSPDDLDDLMADPDDMRMQALVIRERILGPAHPDTSYYIRYRGAVYADAGKFSRCIELWNYALDMQQAMLERLNPMTQSSLFSFTELFSFMIGEEGRPAARGRVVPPVQPAELLRVFVKAAREVELGAAQLSVVSSGASNSNNNNNNNNNNNMERDHTFLTRVLVITLHLACLLARLIQHPACDEATITSVHRALYSLVRLRVRAKLGRSALHLACCRDAALVGRYPACQFPSAQLAELLLRVGAAPNARDDDGNTPLHLAAMARPCPAALARTLLEHGAHLDLVNKHGDTFQTLLRGQHIHELVNTAKYTRLACVAARTIRQFRIPYRGVVPTALEAFIQDH